VGGFPSVLSALKVCLHAILINYILIIFVNILPTNMNFATYSKDVLPIFIN
jgi:hypothetical protein